jgi:hypothetical protein
MGDSSVDGNGNGNGSGSGNNRIGLVKVDDASLDEIHFAGWN